MTGSEQRYVCSLQLLEGCQGIRRQGASFPGALFFRKSSEWCCQLGKIADVASEEIAEAQKLSDLVYIGGRRSVFDSLEFVSARQDALFCQPEAKVRNFFAAKETLLQVYFNAVLDQSL
jgi:hypothetical protein